MTDTLPPFPVDDATLLAVEHALGASLTFDRPDHALNNPDDEGPWVFGADYTLSELLDFIGGTHDPGVSADENPALTRLEDVGDVPCYVDSRVHYSEHCLIRALIAEVRRLRDKSE
jgi:hypothetical protein